VSTSTRPGTAATRRVIGVAPTPSREPSPLDGGLPWVSGVLAAVQAVMLSLAVTVVPAVAVFVVTSADPSNVGVAWTRSVQIGAGLWLLAHGVPLGEVTLIPLGLTAIAWYTAYASARRSARPVPSAFLAALGTYVVLVVAVALTDKMTAGHTVRAALGALVVGGAGLGMGVLRRGDADGLRHRLQRPSLVLPGWLRSGLVAGLVAAGALVVLAALTAAGWVLAGRGQVVGVARGLGLDTVGAAVLAVAELAYVPNLVAWAAAWLAGPGFAVGAGSHFAVGAVVAGPLPAVPLLGALPTGALAGGTTRLAPVLLVVCGLLAGVVVHRRLAAERAWEPAAAAGVAGLVAGLLVTAGVAAAGGAIGAGRMAAVGEAVWAVGALAAAGTALGAALVAVPADPRVRSALRTALRRRPDEVTGSGASAEQYGRRAPADSR
jgi:hypothetical protein